MIESVKDVSIAEHESAGVEAPRSVSRIISMEYDGEITAIEMITLPDVLAELGRRFPGSTLRLQAVIQDLKNAVVEVAVEEAGSADLEQLRQDWKQMQFSQRRMLGIRQ